MFTERGYDLFSLISQFSHSVMSCSLQPYGLQHTRPPCSSPTPGVYSNSYQSSQWCHPTISSFVILFSFCLQPFPTSRYFSMSQFFPLGGQRIGASVSASLLPMNIQDWFPLGWTGWISLQSKRLFRVFSNTTIKSINSSVLSFMVPLSHPYMTTGKTTALTRWNFVGKIMSLLNMLSRLVIAFLPRSKRLLISWLQSPSAVILEPKKIVCFHYLPWSDGTGCHDLSFLNIEFQTSFFHSPVSLLSRSSSVTLCFLP